MTAAMPAHDQDGRLREESLRRVLVERTGVVLQDHQMPTLRAALQDSGECFGYDADQFVRIIEESAGWSPELEWLVSRVTVGESYFFRQKDQIEFLELSWLPEIVARKRRAGDLTLRIWSAGCAAGQEVYTIAILLRRTLPDLAAWTLHLLGTDINTAALSQAVRGEYPRWSLRETPPEVCERWFTAEDANKFRIQEDLRRLVKFAYLNLIEDGFPSMITETHALDLILCRNVFIYFDPAMAGRVAGKLADCLVPGGHLLFGSADLVKLQGARLKLCRWREAFYYVRTVAAAKGECDELPPPALNTRVQARRSQPAVPALPRPSAAEATLLVSQLLEQQCWKEAVEAAGQFIAAGSPTALLLRHKARALANLGAAAEAVRCCRASLELDPSDPQTHFSMGLALNEMNRPEDAEAALRKVIYLDPEFLEAHFHLGLLRMRLGRVDEGLKNLRNALVLAEKAEPDREIFSSAGTAPQRFAEILRNEIGIYAGLKHGKAASRNRNVNSGGGI